MDLQNVPLKTKIIVCIITVTAAFAAGRYTVPEKVRVETKIVEVEKKSTENVADVKTREKKTEVTKVVAKPDGTKETTTTVIYDNSKENDHKTDTTDTVAKSQDKTKEVTHASDKVTVSALIGANIRSPGMVYGASITKPILGPLAVGLFGLSDGTCGGSIGLTF